MFDAPVLINWQIKAKEELVEVKYEIKTSLIIISEVLISGLLPVSLRSVTIYLIPVEGFNTYKKWTLTKCIFRINCSRFSYGILRNLVGYAAIITEKLHIYIEVHKTELLTSWCIIKTIYVVLAVFRVGYQLKYSPCEKSRKWSSRVVIFL